MAQELIQNGQLDRQAAADALREFLEKIIRVAGFQLKVTVTLAEHAGANEPEVIADVDGRDKEILLERGAAVLKAIEHLAFRALRLEPEHHEKIHIDCGGCSALRFEEVRVTAKVAGARARGSKQPFPATP